MNKSKKIIGITALLIFIIFLCSFSFKIFLNTSFPEKELKIYITEFFKHNFNKAVKFEKAYIDICGNLIIRNLEVSITSDFNDDINLIRSRDTTIDLNLNELAKRVLAIENILFENSDITIVKKYGKSYIENFREIFFEDINISDFQGIDLNDFSVEIADSNIFYKEVFKNERLIVSFKKINARVDFTRTKIKYTIEGTIEPYKTRTIRNGTLLLSGEFIFNEKGSLRSRNSIAVENFDISYLNVYLPLYLKEPLFFYGGFSPHLEIKSINKNMSVAGDLDLSDLNVCVSDGEDAHVLVSNENINTSLVLDMLNDFKRIILRELTLSDENVQLSVNGIYSENKKERCIDMHFKSNSIDLSELSQYITPVKGLNYSGQTRFGGRIDYDLMNNRSRNISLSFKIDNLVLMAHSQKIMYYLPKNLNAEIDLDDNTITVNLTAQKNRSDLHIQGKTRIYEWVPLKSDTVISLRSNSFDSGLVFSLLARAFDSIYEEAFIDKSRGYEEIYFTQTPLGELLNNNDINIDVRTRKLLLAHNAHLSNLAVNAELNGGRFRINDFNLSGYDGNFTFRTFLNFDSDFPWMQIKGNVSNFNLEKFSKDAGISGTLSGILNTKFDFQTSAYRFAHFVENTRGKLTVEIASGSLQRTVFQKKLIDFLRKNGYILKTIDDLTFRSAFIVFSQGGENFFIGNATVTGEEVNIRTSGRYYYHRGLSLPFTVHINESEMNGTKKEIRVPLVLRGLLLNPILDVQKKNKRESDTDANLSLYNLQH